MRFRLLPSSAFLLGIALLSACVPLTRSSSHAWELTLQVDQQGPDKSAAVKQAMAVIERRLEVAGVDGFKVETAGAPHDAQILVKLPAGQNLVRLKQLLTTHGKLELVSVISPPNPFPALTYATREEAIASSGERLPADRRVLPYHPTPTEAKWLVVESRAIVDGSQIRQATATPALINNTNYMISFTLKPDGANALGAWTENHINSYIGIAWNDEVKSVAYIRSRISDQGQITGQFTKEAAEDIALILNSGALPGPLRIVSEQHIK